MRLFCFTHVYKIWDKDLTEYQVYISLQIFKKPLDIFSPQIELARSKEFFSYNSGCKRSFEIFSCLEFVFEKTGAPNEDIVQNH